MAGAYDGSIRINTKIDNSGFKSGLKEQETSAKSQAVRLAAQYKRQGMDSAEAWRKAWSEVDKASKTTANKSAGYWKQSAADSKQYVSGISSGFNSLMGTVGKLAAVVGAAFSVTALVQMGQEAIDLASDLQEVDNVVSKSFGSMRGEMDALADTAIEKLGMSRLTAYQTGSTFMSMGKSMLDSMEDAKDMALELTKYTGNMSSFFNVDQSVASTALKGIYTSETEALKQFGVVMTEANLQQFAQEQGIRKTMAAMSRSEKVMLRYKYVTEQLAFIGNDFEDTQASWANQTRILSEQWKELLSILGGGLMTVLSPVVEGLNDIVAALIDMAQFVEEITAKFAEIRAEQMDAATDSTNAATEAMNEYGESIAEAEKQASKLAAFDDLQVLASDSDTETGSSTTTTPLNTEEQQQAIEDMEEKVSHLKELLEKGFSKGLISKKTKEDINKSIDSIKTSVASIFNDPKVQNAQQEFKDQSAETLGTMVGSAESIATSISSGVTSGVESALEDPDLQNFAQEKITAIFGNLTNVQENMQNIATAFAEIGTAFESEGFKELAEFFTKMGTYIDLTALDTITGFTADLVDLFSSGIVENSEEVTELLENVFELLSNLTGPFDDLLDSLISNSEAYEDSWLHEMMDFLAGKNAKESKKALDDVNTLLEELIDLTEGLSLESVVLWFDDLDELWATKIDELIEEVKSEWLSKEKWTEMLNSPKKSFEEWWSGIDRWWNEKISDWSDDNATDWFSKERWNGMLDNVGESFGDWWTDLVTWWCEELPAWWNGEVTPWFTKEKWLQELDNITDAAGEMWDDSFGQIAEDLPEWFDEEIKPWLSKEKWMELGEAMKDGIYEGFKSVVFRIVDVLNSVTGAAEDGINGLVDSVNSFIGGFNSTVPTKYQIGTISQVDFGELPYPHLAQGAVIPPNHQFLAVLGDQTSGTNIEAPLTTIQDALQNVYDANCTGAQEITIRFEGTMAQFVRALKPYIIAEQKRTGTSFRVDEGGGLI